MACNDGKAEVASLLKHYLEKKPPFSQKEFEVQYYNRRNHYFIAYP